MGEELQELKAAYNKEFELTKRKVHEANEHIELLRRELGESDPTLFGKVGDPLMQTGDIRPKLSFLKAQHASNKHLLDILNTNHAALYAKDIGSRLSDEDYRHQTEFYKFAKDLLVMVRDSVGESLMAPPSLQYFSEFKSLVLEWKSTVIAASVVSGTVSGLYGSGLFGNWHPYVWLPKALTFGKFGLALGIAAGATVPLVAIVIVAGMLDPFDCIFHEDEDAVIMRKRLEQDIARLKDNPLPIQDLMDVRIVYERAFRFPICQPTPEDKCIVCREPFQVLSGFEHADPFQVLSGFEHAEDHSHERAPGCRSKHFLHKRCLTEWGLVDCTSCLAECAACKK